MSRKLSVREKVYGYVKRKYGSEPEYLWRRFPDYAVFRHEDKRKCCGIIQDGLERWLESGSVFRI